LLSFLSLFLSFLLPNFLPSFFFLRQSHYVAQVGLELTIVLLLPPKCWDYECAPSCPAERSLFLDLMLPHQGAAEDGISWLAQKVSLVL
jgi:hypothetical protein